MPKDLKLGSVYLWFDYVVEERDTSLKCNHHEGPGAAFGRATSFVVSFVLALNRVNRSSHHNTCLACRCYWTSCSSPLGLHVPSPFGQCTRLYLIFLDFYWIKWTTPDASWRRRKGFFTGMRFSKAFYRQGLRFDSTARLRRSTKHWM